MPINTTSGPIEIPKGTAERVVNTSRIVEEDLEYIDEPEEPEITHVVPAVDWAAVVGGERVPLVFFAVLDNGKAYGVALGSDGRVDNVGNSAEERDGFMGYQEGDKK